MPYDPRQMMQIGQLGIGMMGAPQGNPFDNPAGQRPRQWWEQPIPRARPDNLGSADNADADNGQLANRPIGQAKPPSLLDMMLDLGRMTPAQYNKARQGGGGGLGFNPRGAPEALEMASPWTWLGSMWGGGGPAAGGPR